MQEGMQGTIGIRRRVSLVAMMLDALRDTPVDGARATIEPKHCNAVIKPDGFHVFVNLPGEKVMLTAKAPGYHTVETEIDIARLDPLEPIVRLRLAPQRAESAAWISGRVVDRAGNALAGAQVRLSGTDVYKILEDVETGGDRLQVFNPSGRYLGGALFLLKDEQHTQIVRLQDKGERGYLLEEPVAQRVSRVPARLIRIYETVTDDSGEYRWPFLLEEGEPRIVTVQALCGGQAEETQVEARMGALAQAPELALAVQPALPAIEPAAEPAVPAASGKKKGKGKAAKKAKSDG